MFKLVALGEIDNQLYIITKKAFGALEALFLSI